MKPRRYISSVKVWLNSKYFKTKCNRKLKAKFFRPFRLLHLTEKQAYKLKLLKRWRFHDVFYISSLEQDITRKRQVDKATSQMGSNNREGESGEYKVKTICNSTVYTKESEGGHLSELYYLISWKSYSKEKNTWEPTSTIQHLQRLVTIFHKKYSEKLTTNSTLVDTILPIIKPTVKFTKKWDQPAKASGTNKRTKKS